MSEKLTLKTAKMSIGKTGTIIAFLAQDSQLEGEAAKLFTKTGLVWNDLTKSARFTGKKGQIISVLAPANLEADHLIIIGSGPVCDEDAPQTLLQMTNRGGALLPVLENVRTTKAAIILDDDEMTPAMIAEIAAGLRLRHYSFDKYQSSSHDNDDLQDQDPDNAPAPLEITFHVKDKTAVDNAFRSRMATVHGTLLARDLINEPPNVLGPVEFAKEAQSLASLGLEVEILTPTDMEKLGMGALLAVGQGSSRQARMAIMHWNGGKKSQKPIAFVGKGVVFDSGGVSIKPGAGMQDMKGDMGGAAAVIGLMKTLALRKANVNVVGVIGLAENMPDGNAYRPGDIVTAMSGTTIEIINTDAEGRLVLADALWYTQDRFKPRFMINLATLTGAVMVALGQDYAGLFSNDDELAARLHDAGNITGEKLWRMPLGSAYDKMIKSRFADIKNTGGRYGGAITAAQFLQRFVNDVPWAHLDIAGAGFGSPSSDINKSWASGFGVAVLDQLVRDHYED